KVGGPATKRRAPLGGLHRRGAEAVVARDPEVQIRRRGARIELAIERDQRVGLIVQARLELASHAGLIELKEPLVGAKRGLPARVTEDHWHVRRYERRRRRERMLRDHLAVHGRVERTADIR